MHLVNQNDTVRLVSAMKILVGDTGIDFKIVLPPSNTRHYESSLTSYLESIDEHMANTARAFSPEACAVVSRKRQASTHDVEHKAKKRLRSDD